MDENDIIRAIDNHYLVPYYQPQYDSITTELKSAEALVRWIEPDGKRVYPDQFIPIAERSELVCKIDWYMLEEVCKFLRRELDAGHFIVPVAVNFSRNHFNELDFMWRLTETVDKYKLPHEYIEVEMTESSLMTSDTSIVEWVDRIRKAGFSVAIDDFGSGLSSLSLVKDINASTLKIDKSLISGNMAGDRERIVLESVIEFANRLDLKTIAEGVETEEQLGFLRTTGCNIIQGYYFARPMSEEDFKKACEKKNIADQMVDILKAQAPASALNLLLKAVAIRFPLIIMSNLTRNSFYMMSYDNFTTTGCPVSGVFTDLIAHGASTMHPEDQEIFKNTFSMENMLKAHADGQKYVKVTTRQLGDDGVYRRVQTVDYFVESPSSDDILVVTLCETLED